MKTNKISRETSIKEDVKKVQHQEILFVPGYIEKDSSLENFEELEAVQELIREEQIAAMAKAKKEEDLAKRKAAEEASTKAAEEEAAEKEARKAEEMTKKKV